MFVCQVNWCLLFSSFSVFDWPNNLIRFTSLFERMKSSIRRCCWKSHEHVNIWVSIVNKTHANTHKSISVSVSFDEKSVQRDFHYPRNACLGTAHSMLFQECGLVSSKFCVFIWVRVSSWRMLSSFVMIWNS